MGALGEIARFVLASGAEQGAHAFGAEPVELIDGAQNDEAARRLVVACKPDRLHHAVENLAIVDLDEVVAARNSKLFQGVGGHHAHFGVGDDAGRADRIGVELHELTRTTRTGFSLRKT